MTGSVMLLLLALVPVTVTSQWTAPRTWQWTTPRTWQWTTPRTWPTPRTWQWTTPRTWQWTTPWTWTTKPTKSCFACEHNPANYSANWNCVNNVWAVSIVSCSHHAECYYTYAYNTTAEITYAKRGCIEFLFHEGCMTGDKLTQCFFQCSGDLCNSQVIVPGPVIVSSHAPLRVSPLATLPLPMGALLLFRHMLP
ncbi:uncharacterized protein LOC143297227 [Babylonia areolata]|uniref:uncharacterized protein LOC143297227 n=1 Tax=Babylonia areolata TaxID=304850 RepID=UPI003FD3D1C6